MAARARVCSACFISTTHKGWECPRLHSKLLPEAPLPHKVIEEIHMLKKVIYEMQRELDRLSIQLDEHKH